MLVCLKGLSILLLQCQWMFDFRVGCLGYSWNVFPIWCCQHVIGVGQGFGFLMGGYFFKALWCFFRLGMVFWFLVLCFSAFLCFSLLSSACLCFSLFSAFLCLSLLFAFSAFLCLPAFPCFRALLLCFFAFLFFCFLASLLLRFPAFLCCVLLLWFFASPLFCFSLLFCCSRYFFPINKP